MDRLAVSNLVDLQRMAAVKHAGDQIKRLQDEGYTVDADRMLDELADRIRVWNTR